MTDLPKNWYTSKTVWASILTTIYPLIMVLGKQLDFPTPDPDSVAGVLSAAGTVVAAGIAIYGRVTAKTPIAKPSTPSVAS